MLPADQQQLVRVDPKVIFWPACYMKDGGYNVAIPIEWWISFSRRQSGLLWIMQYPEHSRVIYEY